MVSSEEQQEQWITDLRKREGWVPHNLLSIVILDHAKASFGTQEGMAEQMGVHAQTVSRWVRGQNRPDPETIVMLSQSMDRAPEFLARLGKMTLPEACDIIETYDALYDPVGAARTKAKEKRRQDIHDYFLILVNERRDTMPRAAFEIFLTGDDNRKDWLVQVLDQHPGLPSDTPLDTLNLIVDLHSHQPDTQLTPLEIGE